jgi:capsular exopolysaccharide synthesis family protein
MSRIHEALKRAEQERAEQGGHVENLPVQPTLPVSEAAGDGAAVATAMAEPASSSMPSFASQFTFDTLLARCTQSNWSPDTSTMLFFNADEQMPGTEEFRTLRSRLYQMREKQPLRKVLVSSSLPKEGKTFVAANLAQVMVRQHGRRALLIDADLRAGRLHSALGTLSKPGLSEYLLGEGDEFSIMQRGPMENLFFVPCGRSVSNPAELVANGRLKFLLNRVEPLFDWIIIDSPPAVPVSDASLLSNFCDGVLMVVRSNATPFDIAKRARHEFRDENLIGVVLNGIKSDDSPYSRYYYGSSYGRGPENSSARE